MSNRTYLHPNATNAQKLSDSEYSETKPCLVSETLVALVPSKHAIQAFRLLNENLKAQMLCFPEVDSNVNNAFDSTQATGEFKAVAGKGFMDYVEEIKLKITVIVMGLL
ncbi:hypothetical protein Hanom_Chr15g01399161 [Helianthus anomalus]